MNKESVSGQEVGVSVRMLSELQVTEKHLSSQTEEVQASGPVDWAALWCHLGLRLSSVSTVIHRMGFNL